MMIFNRWRNPAARTITGVTNQVSAVALTFDDGPDPEYTPRVLDLLKQAGVHATFFVIGQALERHPQLAARMVAEGHVLGNHTYTHQRFIDLDPAALDLELKKCSQLIHAATGQRPSLVRPPFGMQDRPSIRTCKAQDLQPIHWNVSSEDWMGHPADIIHQNVMHQLRPGAIVLMHDRLHPPTGEQPEDWDRLVDRQPTLDALANILSDGQAQGLKFLTVPELLKTGKAETRLWHLGPLT